MKSKTNIDTFLEGGAETERRPKADRSPREGAAAVPTEFRKQMVMQLPIALINDLKRLALDQSVRSGRRVTRQQLVEQALKNFLYK